MATSCGQAFEMLTIRAQATGGAVYSDRELLYRTISHAQRIVNKVTRSAIAEYDVAVAASKSVHSMALTLPGAIEIVRVYDASGNAIPLLRDWRRLALYSTTWFRDSGSRVESVASIGHTHFAVYPMLDVSATLTFKCVKLPTALTDYDDELEIADEYVELLLDVAECILLVRQRMPETVSRKLAGLTMRLEGERRDGYKS